MGVIGAATHDEQVDELLDVIGQLHGFLRYGTFDAVRGEDEAYRRGLEVLRRFGREPMTSSTSDRSEA